MCTKEKRWQEFMDWISERSSNFAFRGISDKKHLLLPSVGRADKIDEYKFEKEIFLFNSFKLKTNLLLNAKSDLELLTIAQHYSLPTRLLDWTENPLIACFFAIQNENVDGRIYAFSYKNALNLKLNTNPFEIQDISVVFPPITSDRINLQRGLFTIHPNPDKPCLITPLNMDTSYYNGKIIEMDDAYDFIENLDSIHYNNLPKRIKDESSEEYQEKYYSQLNYIVFDIKKEHKCYFEKQIRLLGIDETIFGDIESIAKKALYECKNYIINDFSNETKNYSNVTDDVRYLLKRRINLFNELISEFSTIRSNIKVCVISEENNIGNENHIYNIKGNVEIYPNYFLKHSERDFFEVNPPNALVIKKINSIFHNLIDDDVSINYKFFNKTHQEVEFSCKYYKASRQISKLEFDFEKNLFALNSKELEIVYNMYTMLYELITIEQKEIIENFEIKLESHEFKDFSTNKLFLSKLSTIADYYKTNTN